MINTPTVLILGAGASMPYDFPSGQELMRTVHHFLDPNNESNWLHILELCSIPKDHIEAFRWELYRSQQPSVDAFLEYRSDEFGKMGKLAIALSIMQTEDDNWLIDRDKEQRSFYPLLFRALKAPFERFHENQLSIVTFNYDRSIEQYLFNALRSAYGKGDEECAEKLSHIPIVHVYGSLGLLPWQDAESGRAYQSACGPQDVQAASERIIVMPHGEETSPEFERAFWLMKEARRVHFLGFGYHETNLQRLKVQFLDERKKKGTAQELGMIRRQDIERDWHIQLFDVNILTFLSDYGRLD